MVILGVACVAGIKSESWKYCAQLNSSTMRIAREKCVKWIACSFSYAIILFYGRWHNTSFRSLFHRKAQISGVSINLEYSMGSGMGSGMGSCAKRAWCAVRNWGSEHGDRNVAEISGICV